MKTIYGIAAAVLTLIVISGGVWFAQLALAHHAIGQKQVQALTESAKRMSTRERPQCLLLC
jgi:hypothetical protein